MNYFEKRLAEIQANPPKAPRVTFDEILSAPDETEPEPLLPDRVPRPRHA